VFSVVQPDITNTAPW